MSEAVPRDDRFEAKGGGSVGTSVVGARRKRIPLRSRFVQFGCRFLARALFPSIKSIVGHPADCPISWDPGPHAHYFFLILFY